MSKLSASKLGLAMACRYWARSDVDYPRRESGPAAELGSCFHEVAEGLSIDEALANWPDVDRDELTALVEAWKPWWEEISQQPEGWQHEVAFAVDCTNLCVRSIPRPTRENHKYETTETEIPGCIDLLLVKDDRVLVGDYKTGQGTKTVGKHITQMEFAAYTAAKFCGKTRAIAFVNHVTPEGVYVTKETFEAADLLRIGGKLGWLGLSVQDAQPCPGDHCTSGYCPAITVCPATTKAVVETMPEAGLVLGEKGFAPLATQAEAAKLYGFMQRAKFLVEQADKMLREFADTNGGVDLGEKSWGKSSRSVPSVDSDKAKDILMREFGARWTDFVDSKVTKSGMVRALEKSGLDKKSAETEVARVFGIFRDAGAVTQREQTVYTERKK